MYPYIKKNLNFKKHVLIFTIICIVISIFIYFLTQKYLIKPRKNISIQNLIPYLHDAKKELRVAKQSIPASTQGLEYNINFWMFLNDYTYRMNQDKVIVQKGEGNIVNPVILLEKNSNNLKIKVSTSYFNSHDETQNNMVDDMEVDEHEEFIVNNIKLQRWTNINITFVDNSIDVYLNGKLVNSFILKGFPKINSGGLVITPNGGFNGRISNLLYTNKGFSFKKIYSIYKNGPEHF
tara:strand:- start:189 stop:896 length:708 start_codon:yes stop_codon:yes gene_type:complete